MTGASTTRTMGTRRAIWYIVSGSLFIVTGILAYFQVTLPSLGGLFLIGAGIVVLFLGLFRYHPTSDALAVFVISLVVFGLFTSGALAFSSGSRTYSFPQAAYPKAKSLSLSLSESFGSIDVSFVNDPNLILNLTYGRRSGFFPFFGTPSAATVVNFTDASTGILTVIASSPFASLVVFIGSFKVNSLNVSTTTGSITVDASTKPNLAMLDAETSLGSITITLQTSTLTHLKASANTGSVNIDAHYLALPRNGTLVATTQTGSVNMNLTLNPSIACDLSASTNFGSVNPTLVGFQNPIVQSRTQLHARSQNYNSASRFLMASLTASTGRVNITAQA